MNTFELHWIGLLLGYCKATYRAPFSRLIDVGAVLRWDRVLIGASRICRPRPYVTLERRSVFFFWF